MSKYSIQYILTIVCKLLSDVFSLENAVNVQIFLYRLDGRPDNVPRVDLYCPGAPQVVVVGEGITRRQDSPRRLALETATALG